MRIQIEKGIPLPSISGLNKMRALLAKMKVGESILIPTVLIPKSYIANNCAGNFLKANLLRRDRAVRDQFTCRTVRSENGSREITGLRVWRVKPAEQPKARTK